MGRKPHRRGPRKRDRDRAAKEKRRSPLAYTTQQVERHDPTREPGSLVLDLPAEWSDT